MENEPPSCDTRKPNTPHNGWSSNPSRFAPVYHQNTELPEKKSEAGCLCFFLGIFGILGVLVAAIIAKKEGVIAALWGWFLTWIGGFILWIILFSALLNLP